MSDYSYLTKRQNTILSNTAEQLDIEKDELISYLLDIQLSRIQQFENGLHYFDKGGE